MTNCIAFHFDLIQDVSALRAIVRLASSMLVERLLLVSPNFRNLDKDGIWYAQIERLANETGASILSYQTEFDVFQKLARRRGLCVAGSESDVRAHRSTHLLFQSLPPSFLRVTLQHGFECLGFLHNERHSAGFGRNIRFAADIIVGWFDRSRLRDVSESEAAKLYVAGPMSLIEERLEPDDRACEAYVGMVCENTHSIRFSSSDMRRNFLEELGNLARRLRVIDKPLYLRPHPAGQFVAREGYKCPDGVLVEDAPLFDVDLGRLSYAISAPSTVLFDFVLADVPIAIWGGDKIDISNFAGLRTIHNGEDWWRFVSESVVNRGELLANQRQFLGQLGIPDDVRQRYSTLLALAGA